MQLQLWTGAGKGLTLQLITICLSVFVLWVIFICWSSNPYRGFSCVIQIWRGGDFHEKFPMKREDWSLVIVMAKQISSLFHFSLCKTKAHWDFWINIWIWKSCFLLTKSSPFSVPQILNLVYFNHCYSLIHPYFQQVSPLPFWLFTDRKVLLLLLLADSSFHVLVKHSNQLWQKSILFCILILSF